MAGEIAGATLAFSLARLLGRRWVEKWQSERWSRWDRRIGGRGILSVAIFRLVLLPFDSVSYACGLSTIRLRDFLMGTVAGGIASGRVPEGGVAGDPWDSWINPTSILGGVLAVAVVAFLASVYLVWDARRLDPSLEDYFRRRAVVMSVVTGAIAIRSR